MKLKATISFALAAVMSIALLAGCGGSTPTQTANSAQNQPAQTAPEESEETPADSGDTVKIGILAPLTGEVSVYGVAASNGAKLAIEEINANGGLLGKQIEYVEYDDKGDPTEAKNGYAKLMSQGIVGLVGAVTSKPTAAVAIDAAKDGIPMVTPTATALDVTTYGNNVFRACFIDPFQGEVMANFATNRLNAAKAAVLYDTGDDYSVGLAESFLAQFQANGGEVVKYEGYASGDKDFRSQLVNITAESPDVVFFPVYYSDLALMAMQAKEVGLDAVLLGADGWDGVLGDGETKVIDDPSALEGAFFCNHYSPDDPDEAVQQFIKDYTAKYNMPPVSFGALGYDAMKILAAAIENADSTDFDAVVTALQNIDVTVLTGRVTFNEDRNPIKSVSILQINNGQTAMYEKMDPQ